MKNIILLFCALFIISCSSEENEKSSVCEEVSYETTFELRLNDEACFPDGNTLIFTAAEHQFCPCGAICIWAGDLFITLTSTNELEESITKTFYPTNLKNDRSIFNNHEISTFSYSYDGNGGEVPNCAEDFDDEKLIIALSITPL